MPKVILIDDEHGPVNFYVKALQQSGFEVEHLETVAAALEHISATPVAADFYVLDLMMPPGDALDLEEAGFGLKSGIEIHRRLRKRFPDIPVIVLTSVSNPAILDVLPFDDNTERETKIDVLPFELVEKIKQRLKPTNA